MLSLANRLLAVAHHQSATRPFSQDVFATLYLPNQPVSVCGPSRRDMSQLSKGQQRRRGPRSASRGGPGRVDSTRHPAEKVSFKWTTIRRKLPRRQQHTASCNSNLHIEQRGTDCDSQVKPMQFKDWGFIKAEYQEHMALFSHLNRSVSSVPCPFRQKWVLWV